MEQRRGLTGSTARKLRRGGVHLLGGRAPAYMLEQYVVVSLEARQRVVDGIRILPWATFLELLWGGAFV